MKTDLWLVSFVIYFGLIFGWIYSIGKILNENNPEWIKKLNIWSIVYLIAVIPFAIQSHDISSDSHEQPNALIDIASGIIGLVSIVNIGIISAKSLKEREQQKELKFADYFLEFFLIIFLVFGIWVLQPRLNAIVKQK